MKLYIIAEFEQKVQWVIYSITSYDAIKTCEDKRFRELQITVTTKRHNAQRTASAPNHEGTWKNLTGKIAS
jgi:hypothetical protein